MLKYIRYLSSNIFILVTLAGFLLGGHWLWMGIGFSFTVLVFGDFVFGDDTSEPKYAYPQILNLILYSYLPVMIGLGVVFVWMFAPGDLFGIGAMAETYLGYDALAARTMNTGIDYVGAFLGFGLLMAVVNTLIAHELTHRTWDKLGMFFGRWFFAMSGGIPFEVEHVYGHHTTLGLDHDASLSLRRQGYYNFFATAPLKQLVYAWKVETDRLAKRGKSTYSPSNVMLRSGARIGLVWALVFAAGGGTALGFFVLAAFWSKMLLEALGYMFHHGQVRDITQPDGPRHSWNSNKRLSSVILFNINKHSEHHERANAPFYELYAREGEVPMLKYGAILTGFAALIPPLFFRMMGPQVRKWDEQFATDKEKEIAARQNAESGLSVYMRPMAAAE